MLRAATPAFQFPTHVPPGKYWFNLDLEISASSTSLNALRLNAVWILLGVTSTNPKSFPVFGVTFKSITVSSETSNEYQCIFLLGTMKDVLAVALLGVGPVVVPAVSDRVTLTGKARPVDRTGSAGRGSRRQRRGYPRSRPSSPLRTGIRQSVTCGVLPGRS